MATNNDKPKSLDEVLASIESRGMAWKGHIDKYARIGESWEAADARLRREITSGGKSSESGFQGFPKR